MTRPGDKTAYPKPFRIFLAHSTKFIARNDRSDFILVIRVLSRNSRHGVPVPVAWFLEMQGEKGGMLEAPLRCLRTSFIVDCDEVLGKWSCNVFCMFVTECNVHGLRLSEP